MPSLSVHDLGTYLREQRESRHEFEDQAGEAVSVFEAKERRDVRMVE